MPYDHLQVEPKNYYKSVNITKKKQIHRYEWTSGYEMGEVSGDGQYRGDN